MEIELIIAEIILKKKNRAGGTTLSNIKIYCRPPTIEAIVFAQGQTNRDGTEQNQAKDLPIYEYLIYVNDGTAEKGEDGLATNGTGLIGYPYF